MFSPARPILYSWIPFLLVAVMLGGCASFGVVENQAVEQLPGGQGYRLTEHYRQHPIGDVLIMLAFSGGGTRAAALSYGVLKALRDARVAIDGQEVRLLDEVDRISSVSGGSFTSAYYGLYGDRIFDDYEQVFLRKNVQAALTEQLLNPLEAIRRGISGESRSEIAVRYYDKHIFDGATFADLRKDGPFIFINASDLGAGEQFVFFQEGFDLLCSDLSPFKIARAVAASSAVPVVFDPIVLDNHDECVTKKSEWLLNAETISTENYRLKSIVRTLNGYLDKDNQRYIHLVDGGITDNLGVRPIYTGISALENINQAARLMRLEIPEHIVLIVVDASTQHETGLSLSRKTPSLKQTISQVTNAQLHRYNTETIELIKGSMSEWKEEANSSGLSVSTYFIRLRLDDIVGPRERAFYQEIPTSFSLSKKQVDGLIEMGGRLLREDSEYARLLKNLNAIR